MGKTRNYKAVSNKGESFWALALAIFFGREMLGEGQCQNVGHTNISKHDSIKLKADVLWNEQQHKGQQCILHLENNL